MSDAIAVTAEGHVLTSPRGRKPNKTTPRKPREKKRYEVQQQSVSDGVWLDGESCLDTDDGLRIIAASGNNGMTYRVVCIMAQKTVKVQTKEIRTLE